MTWQRRIGGWQTRVWLGLASLLLTAAAPRSMAGQYNADRSIGDPGAAWQGLPGVDGQLHSLADLAEHQAVVVVFTCNTCPYAVDYEDRLCRLARKYAMTPGKVAVVAINVHTIEEDLLPAMQRRAAEKAFPFPYLHDATQQIAKDYGAARTPEFFLLDQERKIVYMGAMDDNTKEAEVKRHYLEEAIAAVLAGKPVAVSETPPVGCAIRYQRRRGG
jgi:peroxiredoxin